MSDSLNSHIERILADRVYWLVNQADYRLGTDARRVDHIFESLVALKNHVTGEHKSPDDYCNEYVELQIQEDSHAPDGQMRGCFRSSTQEVPVKAQGKS